MDDPEQSIGLRAVGGGAGQGGRGKEAGFTFLGVERHAARLGGRARESFEYESGRFVGQATPPWFAGQRERGEGGSARRPWRGTPSPGRPCSGAYATRNHRSVASRK